MARKQEYLEPRTRVSVRIPESLLQDIDIRMDELDIKEQQKYLMKLIEDDLAFAQFERKKKVIDKIKKEKP